MSEWTSKRATYNLIDVEFLVKCSQTNCICNCIQCTDIDCVLCYCWSSSLCTCSQFHCVLVCICVLFFSFGFVHTHTLNLILSYSRNGFISESIICINSISVDRASNSDHCISVSLAFSFHSFVLLWMLSISFISWAFSTTFSVSKFTLSLCMIPLIHNGCIHV